MEKKINYKKLELKVGLEIHEQLDTKSKLFCGCSTTMQEKNPISIIKRKQHPVESELGEVDRTAQFEYLRNRTFHYQVFSHETCLVEADCEPPHNLNQEALETAIQIALMLNCEVPNEIHVMRKTVIDGSNTSGFQRTMIVGRNGYISYKGEKIGIKYISLEEDAAALVKEENGNVTYRLNRLGVPLVEIATEILTDYTPEEIQDIAYTIGMTGKSTGKIKRGIGTIRQDVNVSIRNGERVELKGVQDLGILAKVIELEVKRQLTIKKVEKETRAVKENGTTEFTRPLPGAHRMYPETDTPPVSVEEELISRIKKELPEPWTKKLARFKSKFKLSDQLAKEILRSEYQELFEKIVQKKVEPSIVANTFTSLIKDLEKRENVKIENLTERHYLELFDHLAAKRIVKEAIPEILKYLASRPGDTVSNAIVELDLKPLSMKDLKSIVEEVVGQPGINYDKGVGIVMSKVRGKIDAQTVMKIVRKMRH